jgi:hypothetical protein
VRDGEIVGVRGADGGPPYEVRWSDSHVSGLFYPGPDAHVTMPEQAPASTRSTSEWRVNIDVFEVGDETTAHAVLVGAPAAAGLDASGEAHRNPSDVPVSKIGDEVAVARALRALSDRLLETASAEMSGSLGHRAAVAR